MMKTPQATPTPPHNHLTRLYNPLTTVLHAGVKVAFNAFALLDGFGRKAPPVLAAKYLVNNITAAVAQAEHAVHVPHAASPEEVAYALQAAFAQALPKV